MATSRPLSAHRNDSHVIKIGSGNPAGVEVSATHGSERHLDYRTLLRISSSASTRAGTVIELMSERSRANCAAMRSQF